MDWAPTPTHGNGVAKRQHASLVTIEVLKLGSHGYAKASKVSAVQALLRQWAKDSIEHVLPVAGP